MSKSKTEELKIASKRKLVAPNLNLPITRTPFCCLGEAREHHHGEKGRDKGEAVHIPVPHGNVDEASCGGGANKKIVACRRFSGARPHGDDERCAGGALGGHNQDRRAQACLHADEEAGGLHVRGYIGGETVREGRAISQGGEGTVSQDAGRGIFQGYGTIEGGDRQVQREIEQSVPREFN